MNSKMTTNSQLSTTDPKETQTKQTTRTGTESQKCRSHGVYQRGGENGQKGTGNRQHIWKVQDRRGDVKNTIGKGEAKELISMTHGHELRVGGVLEGSWHRAEGNKREWEKWTTVIA